MPGLFNLYWDERTGKLWLEIGQWQQEFLYQSALPAGFRSTTLGSLAASSARREWFGSSGSGQGQDDEESQCRATARY